MRIINVKVAMSIFYRRIQTIYYKHILSFNNSRIIMLIGCGRSGTTFSSQWLNAGGLKIGHERLLKNGISSWYLVSKQKKVPIGPSFDELKKINKLIIHQVREPLTAISSLQTAGSTSWEFIAKDIPIKLENDSTVLKAMKYYYYWNIQAEKMANYRVKAEEFTTKIPHFLEINGIKLPNGIPKLSQESKINTRKHSQLTWKDLIDENKNLTEDIMRLADKYGYVV